MTEAKQSSSVSEQLRQPIRKRPWHRRSLCQGPSLLGAIPVAALHDTSGSWDEIASLGLAGLVLAGIAVFNILGGRRKGGKARRRK